MPPPFPQVRFAVFKSFVLGDQIKGPETWTLDGDDAQRDSVLYGDKAIITDRGSGSFYNCAIRATLIRGRPNGIPTPESYEQFMVRRMNFLINMRKARGYYPATNFDTTAGTLAVGEDASQIVQSTAPVVAGSTVNIPVDVAGRTVINNSLWFIFDTNNHEAFLANAGTTSPVQAQALVNGYDSGAFLFRATLVLLRASMKPGVKVDGDGEGSTGAVKDIPIEFESVDDPISGALA